MLRPGARAPLDLAIAALALVASTAFAHETWMLAAAPESGAAATVLIELTSGMDFPVADYAIRADRISAIGCRNAQGACAVAARVRGAHALELGAAGAASGAVVWIDLAPKTLTLSAAKVAEYFDDIDASPEIRARWKSTSTPKQWRETYIKHAKTIVGDGGEIAPWSAMPSGQSLEVVPVAGSVMRVGTAAAFKVLRRGQSLTGFPVVVFAPGRKPPRFLHTDDDGALNVQLDHAGAWMLALTDLNAPAQQGGTWHSDFATLTFVVR